MTNFKRFCFYLFLILFISVAILIVCFSLQNGAESSSLSDGVGNYIAKILGSIGINVDSSSEEYEKIIRKLVGHFGMFLADSLFAVFMILSMKRNAFKKLIISLIILVFGLCLAVLSECLQILNEDRGPNASDVMIDFCGFLVPFMIYLPFLIYNFYKDKKLGREIEI